ncbi:MAG: hypothetical protein M1542_08375 [Thermotogae bacterium]|jgi:hypothetical protein|nr:hypothetical protein [Thermotogota bacterium]MCL5033243.1 hypothetical protein [Thermotogota bacterium]
MKLNEFLNQYFDAYFKELKDKFSNVDEKELKDIFLFGFKEGFTFDIEIITDLNDEIIEVKNNERILPNKVKEFFHNTKSLTQ